MTTDNEHGRLVAEALCGWCNINPAQRPNGECDDCWHLPGHEGEYEPTLKEERRERDCEALRAENERLQTRVKDFTDLVKECVSLRDVMGIERFEKIYNEVWQESEGAGT